MKKRVGPKLVWVVTDGAGRGVYSVHRTREKARAACYFWGSRAVRYALLSALVACLVGCASTVTVPVREIPRTSQCACRVLCAPDGYWWSLEWQMPGVATEAGHCTCVGVARRLGD